VVQDPAYPEIWNVTGASSPAGGSFPWSYLNVPNWTGKDGPAEINVRAYDEAGNFATSYSTRIFTIDALVPISITTKPVAGNPIVSAMTSIAGTATDAIPGPDDGIVQVELRIHYQNAGLDYYWNGSTWTQTGSPIWRNATGAGSGVVPWVYNPANIANNTAWTTGVTYDVQSRAIDGATNVELSFTTRTFTFDNTPPSSDVTLPTIISRTSNS
jgi:hypothetical protein